MLIQKKATYADAIGCLNGKSLEDTLELFCFFSCIEFAGGIESPVFPLLNHNKVRLLADALVKSKANWYKDRLIAAKELPALINGANSVPEKDFFSEVTNSDNERHQMLYQMQKCFSRMAYLQIRPQKMPFFLLGQLLATTEALPAQYDNESKKPLQESITTFPSKVKEAIGTTVAETISTHIIVISYFNMLGRKILDALRKATPKARLNPSQQTKVLIELLSYFTRYQDLFQLHPAQIERAFDKNAANGIPQYGKIFGRSIRDHRALLSRPEYQIGQEGLRLSSLDRFPLIANEETTVWHVPNVRGLYRAAPDILHFTLNEKCRELYETVRGPLLEMYLTKLLKKRAPALTVIPEEKWHTNKGEGKGPDFVLIEHGSRPIVIGIEVKFRRMVPRTRFELHDEDIVTNYSDIWAAIKKLPNKLSNVMNLKGEYQKHEDSLLRAREYPRFHLGIVGEAPFMFGEISSFQAANNDSFPLYGFTESWGVMSVEVFEHFIEIAVQHQRSFADILEDYQSDCSNIEPSCPMAENFRGATINFWESFAASFLSDNLR